MSQETGPRLAVVVAAYNAAATIGAALDSVLCQSYDNWEVVVVDDGSVDHTLAVAEEYAARDSRIKVLHQDNAGSGAARNAGLAVVGADFVAYLDADDVFADNYMPAMLQLMLDFPDRDIYSSDGLYVFADGSTRPVFDYAKPTKVDLEDLIWDCRILGGGALVRVSVIRALGGFREHMYGEDYDLWLRALAAGHSHIASPELLYIYHLCVDNQKSTDPASGARSAEAALADLIDSGVLDDHHKKQALASMAKFRAAYRLEERAQRFRQGIEAVVGARYAPRVIRVVHSVSWIIRPIRRRLAERRGRS